MKTVIAIITFNKPELLGTQIKLFRRFVNADLIVFDNSTNYEASTIIKEICDSESVPFVKLIINEGDSSRSHGLALGFAYKFCRDYEIIVLCDHDIFPFKPFDFSFVTTFGGVHQVRGEFIYVWAGLLIIKNKNQELDFMPQNINGVGLDTGGGLWDKMKDAIFLQEKREDINGREYSVIGDCLMHFSNASAWRQEENHAEIISLLMNRLNEKVNEV